MRACPFCSGDEIELKQYTIVRTHAEIVKDKPQMQAAYYECQHCRARGSQFLGEVGEPKDDIDVCALHAWNGEHR